MSMYDNTDAWLLTRGFDRKPEFLQAGQARDHKALIKLAEFLSTPPHKGANISNETEIWDFWQALPLREAADLPRAQAFYFQVAERGGPGSNLVQEGLLGLICATGNPASIPFWVSLLDFKPAQKRDNFRRQRQSYALAALARLAVQHDEAGAFEALTQAAHHPEPEVREQAIDYLGRCYRVNDRSLPTGIVELLTDLASRDEAFAPRFQARMILRQAGRPVPQDPAPLIYSFIIQFKRYKHLQRIIEVSAEQTLADLQTAIQQSLGWDNDHAYTFFMNGDEDDRRFALRSPAFDAWGFEDDDANYLPTAADITLGELGLGLGHTFLYLFDYGDRHLFTIQLGAITTLPPEKLLSQLYPHLVESRGEAPAQYPEWDEDEVGY